MRADIAGRAADARLRRIGAPGGLFLAGLLDRFRQPVLRIFGLDDSYIAEFAVRDHLTRMADHWITGIVMRQHEESGALIGDLLELLGISKIGCQRLIADD